MVAKGYTQIFKIDLLWDLLSGGTFSFCAHSFICGYRQAVIIIRWTL